MNHYALTHQGFKIIGFLLINSLLANIAIAVEVGERAPNFTLPSTTGDQISLDQYKGKKNVLIQFYSTDFNPT